MTQIRIFRNANMDLMENEVNRWLQENADKVTVINVQNSQLLSESPKVKTVHMTTITYDDAKSKILHG